MNLRISLLFLTAVGISSSAFAAGGPLLHRTAGLNSSIGSSLDSAMISTANLPTTPAGIEQTSQNDPDNDDENQIALQEIQDPEISPEISPRISKEELETRDATPPSEIFPELVVENNPPSVPTETLPANNGRLITSLTAEGVKLARSNRLAGYGENEDLKELGFLPRIWERMKFKNWDGAAGFSRQISCSQFKGTHAGNKVYFKAEASGGSGRYIHSLIYTLNSSFESPEANGKQFELSRKGNGIFKIKLPPLRDDISYVQLTVLLLTRDLDHPRSVASKSITFLVARPVILSLSTSPEAKQNECYERFLPYPSTMGILSNGSKNPSKIEIQQATQNSWAATQGWQAGVFLSPFSSLVVGNLLFFNFSYFQQTTKKIVETVAVSTDFRLNPGEFMQIYTQPTRYITPYDATLVEACGQTRKIDSAYLFQWWGYSYIPYPIRPDQLELPRIENIGAPAINTCPEELTPSIGERSRGTYEFRSTM